VAGPTDRVGDILRVFTKRFAGTGVEASALAVGAILAMEVAQEELHEEWLGILRERHGGKEHLREFLRTFQAYPLEGKRFEAELTLLDGTKLRLPDDFRGNLAVVVFFQLGGHGQADQRSRARHDALRELNRLNGMLDKHKSVAAVGICLDGDRETLEESAKKQKWKWHVALGKGPRDETTLKYSASHMTGRPHYLLLSKEGIILYADSYVPPWGGRRQDIRRALTTAVQTPEALMVTAARDRGRLDDIEQLWRRAVAHGKGESWQLALKELGALIGHAQQCKGREHLAKYYRLRAEAHEALGKTDEARVDREWALSLHRSRGDWPEALADVNKLIDFAREAEDRAGLLRHLEERIAVLRKLGRDDEARRDSEAHEALLRGGRDPAGGPTGVASAETRGAICRWHVVGPFDIGPRKEPRELRKPRPYVDLIVPPVDDWKFDGALPPEEQRDPTDAYASDAGGEKRWVVLTSAGDGVTRLDLLYGPAQSTAYCALAYVHAPAKGSYEMKLNSYNHAEVWVAGKPVGARTRKETPERRPEWGQARFYAELAPGWNEVFLRIGDGLADRVRFRLEIVDPEGKLRFGLYRDAHDR
jgi:tetratricopeptide (TPR) repeat protein